jgi:hypothetical protein
MRLDPYRRAPVRLLPSGILVLAWAAMPHAARACAVCYGAAGSDQTAGLNAAILFLLGVVGVVQAGLVAMFVAIWRRGRAYRRRRAELHLIEGGAR